MASKIKPTNKKLFRLPIVGDLGKGEVVVTLVAPKVYLLSWAYGEDNRLTTPFCQAVILALDIIEKRYDAGVVITTSSIPKFYSNGMDIFHSLSTPHYFNDSLYYLFRRLLTYPMPTVALMNGHAFAGGFMLALMQDYRIMNPHRGFACLNEIELGVPLRPPMTAIFRQKVSPSTLRKVVLEAHRFKALEAMKEGLVDWLGGLEEALAHIEEFQLVKKALPGMNGVVAYGELKEGMWSETVAYLESWRNETVGIFDAGLRHKLEDDAREVRVKAWEKQSKL